jgi:hypothetical protein
MEKVAQTGAVTLKNAGRSMMVEAREDGDADATEQPGEAASPQRESAARSDESARRPVSDQAAPPATDDDEESLPQSPMTMQDGIRAVQQAFATASPAPRWPMYVRQAKQYLKTRIDAFDERKYGFASVVDLLRAAGKEGVLRVERDRHGAVRVFPGQKLSAQPPMPDVDEMIEDAPIEATEEFVPEAAAAASTVQAEIVEEAPIVDAQALEEPAVEDGTPKKSARKRKAPAKATKTTRARKSTRKKSEAA